MKLGRATIDSIPIERPTPTAESPQGLCLDRGYDDTEVRDLCDEFGFTAHIRGRGEEAQAIKREAGFRARRWVVERTHSWKRRCAELDEQIPVAFNAFHCMLVRSTSRIAFSASRSGTRGL